jgi:DNA-binding NtrC family response regulator
VWEEGGVVDGPGRADCAAAEAGSPTEIVGFTRPAWRDKFVFILREVSLDTPSAPPAAGRVVVVDDDDLILRSLARALGRAGYQVLTCESAAGALGVLDREGQTLDLVISDLHMPDIDGFELLSRVRAGWPHLPVMMLSGDTAPASAVEALRRGAYDYLTKPLETYDGVVLAVARAVEHRRLVERNRLLERQIDVSERWKGIVGATPVMRELFGLVESVAPTDAAVLLLGESGTGKEVLARAIHARSARSGRPFVSINGSATNDTLLESELFGHVRGAFAGASGSRVGGFEEAAQGTLFLDEIGDLSPLIQERLLRVLEEGLVKPVGAADARKVNVRIVAATSRDLEAAVRAGTFRADLHRRLNVVSLELPPLRHRPEDIPLLVHHFLTRDGARYGKPASRFTAEAMEALQAHAWPGNVRELENVIQRVVVLSAADELGVEVLPAAVRTRPPPPEPVQHFDLPFGKAKQAAVQSFERSYLSDVLRRSSGKVAEAARLCGLDKSNFRRIIRRHKIDADDYRRKTSGGPR